MKVVLFTNEYPPRIYGGAGVHVDYLSRYLARLMEVEVRAFGQPSADQPKMRIRGFTGWDRLTKEPLPFTKVLETLAINLAFNGSEIRAELVHAHTWYTFFAGFLAKILYTVPLVVTMHSLEPLRPWKEEQLATGYRLSSWVEKNGVEAADRVIAVSAEMKADLLRCYAIPEEKVAIIHNGIDLVQYRPTGEAVFLKEEGISSPYLLFVGRISRQKGILQLIEAFNILSESNLQLVLCAGASDTPDLETEIRREATANPRIKWLRKMVSREEVIQLYSHAAIFICPSVYEPFGIINLEAMACKAPVIASRVGGIKEVVVDGETGILVPPAEPEKLAGAIRFLLTHPEVAQKFRERGRKRVEDNFGWERIALKTKELYEEIIFKN